MLSDSDGERELREYEDPPGTSSDSWVAPRRLNSPPALAVAPGPRIDQFNAHKNSKVYIGDRFIKVSKTVHHTEVVKEVGPVRYLWEWARRTSFAERIAFCVSLAALALCGVLVCTLTGQEPITEPDIEKEWNITRTTWLAVPREVEIFPYDPSVLPLRLVVVQHTAGAECFKFADCSGLMRLLQQYFLEKYDYDIPYNFVVANDGRVYEGRGYVGGVAAHTLNYNRCSMGLGFTGDYRRIGGGSHVTELQLNRTLQLLEGGVRDGIIHPRYVVVAASDLKPTASPGDDIYEAMSQWPNFNVDKNRFRNRTCEDIYDELRALDKKEPDSVRRTGSR